MSEAASANPGISAEVPATGTRGPGRPGGEESRARIVEAAGRLFSERGFDGVSVRELARRAKVNGAAINYHFGGKAGLYHAVLRRLIDDTEPMFTPMVARLRAGAEQAEGDPEALAALIELFVSGLLSNVLSGANFRWQIPIMLREFQDPSDEFPMLVRERIDPLHDALCAVVGAATGKSAEAPETRLLTANIIGQCMMFGAARGVVFTRLDWEEYTPERIELIIETMVPRIQAMLGLRPAPGAAEGRSE
jgi:AcrR family transcriptional regulator